MSINSNIKSKVESHLGETIISDSSVSGGCIADSRIIKTSEGNRYFLKTHSGKPGMFLKEANGLNEMANAKCIRVPEVILADESFLLLENIEQGSKTGNFFTKFGQEFACMHKHTSDEYGYFEDNYIGSSPQYNMANGKEKTSWAEFYFQKRILPQLRMAEENGYGRGEMASAVHKLEGKMKHILEGSEEPPCIIHGDLWGGNYLCDADGNAVLIDPAAYFGHREADLAMTKMFGGFSGEFYASYQKVYPLEKNWKYRENLYLLYHYLNHLNLFGTGYYQTSINLINFYL